MKILFVNLHSTRNAGDDALTQEALRQLTEQFPSARFTLAMNDPDSYHGIGRSVDSFTAWVKPVSGAMTLPRWRWRGFPELVFQSLLALVGYRLTGKPWFIGTPHEHRTLLTAYFEADLVVSAAGNFLYSSSRLGLPLILALYAIYYASLAGKPVYTLPQTIGPFRSVREQLMTRSVLSRLRLLLVRDPISAELWERWGRKHVAWRLIPDLAFAQGIGEDTERAVRILAEHGLCSERDCPWLGVTAIRWGAQSRFFSRQTQYEDALVAAIRDFISQHQGHAILFAQVQGPTAAEDDLIAARRIMARLRDVPDRVTLIDQTLPPSVLKAAYGQMDILLGTRLHSTIFALAEGVPVVAIGYQYKTRGVMRLLDLEQWMVDIEFVDQDALIQLVRRAWDERFLIRRHLQQVLIPVRQEARRAGALIASDFHCITTRVE